MSTPDPGQFIDAGNPLLSQAAVRLETGSVSSPEGKLGVLTFRTATTTLTVFLESEDLRTWSSLLRSLADSLNASQVIQASALDMAALDQASGRHRRPA